jgi:Tol biopolymer transport system component
MTGFPLAAVSPGRGAGRSAGDRRVGGRRRRRGARRPGGGTTRLSVSSDGVQGNNQSVVPAVSANGRYVAFTSNASNLVPGHASPEFYDVHVRDLVSGTTSQVSVDSHGAPADGQSFNAAISGDGHQVAFDSGAANLVPGDTNRRPDVFVRHTSQ